MPIKISDYLPTAQYSDSVSIKALDNIGDYLKESILNITIPVGGVYVDTRTPYTNKIRNNLISFANTLPDRTIDYGHGHVVVYKDKDDLLNAINTSSNKISLLINAIESVFTTTQAGALIQFNTPNPAPPPLVLGPTPPGSPYAYVDGTFSSAIQPVLEEITTLVSTAFESFIKECYLNNGLI